MSAPLEGIAACRCLGTARKRTAPVDETRSVLETRIAAAPRWPVDCCDPGGMGNKSVRSETVSRFRSALKAERNRLAGGRQIDSEMLALPGSVAVDDQAPLMHDQFVALRHHRMERRKLKLIDAALERLDGGEFGICAECGDAIPFKRLEANSVGCLLRAVSGAAWRCRL